jgi:hypothetical protein
MSSEGPEIAVHDSEGGCGDVSIAGGSSSEGDTGTAGNAKFTKPGKQQRPANCHVNVATSPKLFTIGDVKSVAP